MSDEILQDDQLDEIAGGTGSIVITAKKSSSTYSSTVRSDIVSTPTPPSTNSLNRAVSTARLGSLRSTPNGS